MIPPSKGRLGGMVNYKYKAALSLLPYRRIMLNLF